MAYNLKKWDLTALNSRTTARPSANIHGKRIRNQPILGNKNQMDKIAKNDSFITSFCCNTNKELFLCIQATFRFHMALLSHLISTKAPKTYNFTSQSCTSYINCRFEKRSVHTNCFSFLACPFGLCSSSSSASFAATSFLCAANMGPFNKHVSQPIINRLCAL